MMPMKARIRSGRIPQGRRFIIVFGNEGVDAAENGKRPALGQPTVSGVTDEDLPHMAGKTTAAKAKAKSLPHPPVPLLGQSRTMMDKVQSGPDGDGLEGSDACLVSQETVAIELRSGFGHSSLDVVKAGAEDAHVVDVEVMGAGTGVAASGWKHGWRPTVGEPKGPCQRRHLQQLRLSSDLAEVQGPAKAQCREQFAPFQLCTHLLLI